MLEFRSNVSDDVLGDLKQRLRKPRWPDQIGSQDWNLGTDLGFLKRVCAYWESDFDWRVWEARLNTLPQFRTDIDGLGLHFVHVRSSVPGAVPLLLMNGWPSSIFEYVEVIPRLVDLGFHVVAPALPGYGFSDMPSKPGMNGTSIAALFADLMQKIGYDRFIAHGSDWGSLVVDRLRRHHPNRLIGIHMSNVHSSYPISGDPSPDECTFLKQAQGWQFSQGAYAMIQGTKPQTLAYGLNDSPVGLAAWILEKFRAWTDGDPEEIYGLDGLCANLTLYWVTETICSSMRLYAEHFADPEGRLTPEPGAVPAGVLVFANDQPAAPRGWGERWFDIVHWTDAPKGGHFGAWEQPDAFVADLRKFADLVGRAK